MPIIIMLYVIIFLIDLCHKVEYILLLLNDCPSKININQNYINYNIILSNVLIATK